ncbi:MAG: tetratricopeptide repeat protein [Bacteroides sp.]|nr:tetratricopeptide repeat protein [Prevotella sp.]MCM1407319.1 tetratricopeptide repeat protein [Treponema brennaborense]MCM1469809.1 tetratricopeptide repeat protein [Bacteroides sp.]
MRTVLDKAEWELNLRHFSKVLSLLEPRVMEYRESFRFFYTLGVACLYVGDIGGAESYFKRARQIHVNDPDLQLAYVALFLRRGETDRAVDYCLSILDECPTHRRAAWLLRFIRTKGDPETLFALSESGKIKKCYPVLGFPPQIKTAIMSVFICGFLCIAAVHVMPSLSSPPQLRADISALDLTAAEKHNPLESDLGTQPYRYILTQKEAEAAYEEMKKLFQKYDDNGAQILVNRLLYSNAAASVKQKARLLMEYFSEPTFDSMLEKKTRQLSYQEVAADPFLYLDCWVVWSGRVANLKIASASDSDNSSSSDAVLPPPDTAEAMLQQKTVVSDAPVECNFLVGYDTMQKIDGIVPLVVPSGMQIETERPLKILARIGSRDGQCVLFAKSIYQPFR